MNDHTLYVYLWGFVVGYAIRAAKPWITGRGR